MLGAKYSTGIGRFLSHAYNPIEPDQLSRRQPDTKKKPYTASRVLILNNVLSNILSNILSNNLSNILNNILNNILLKSDTILFGRNT